MVLWTVLWSKWTASSQKVTRVLSSIIFQCGLVEGLLTTIREPFRALTKHDSESLSRSSGTLSSCNRKHNTADSLWAVIGKKVSLRTGYATASNTKTLWTHTGKIQYFFRSWGVPVSDSGQCRHSLWKNCFSWHLVLLCRNDHTRDNTRCELLQSEYQEQKAKVWVQEKQISFRLIFCTSRLYFIPVREHNSTLWKASDEHPSAMSVSETCSRLAQNSPCNQFRPNYCARANLHFKWNKNAEAQNQLSNILQKYSKARKSLKQQITENYPRSYWATRVVKVKVCIFRLRT